MILYTTLCKIVVQHSLLLRKETQFTQPVDVI